MGELNTKMTALADEVRGLGGASDKLGIAAMTDTISAANDTIDEQTDLLTQINLALNGKAIEDGGEIALQNKTVTPTKNTQNVAPDAGYDGLSRVTVNPIPNEYIIPAGTKQITSNGTVDVTQYASATISVPAPTIKLQDKSITANGSYSADSSYDGLGTVTVAVPIPSGYIKPTGSKNINANGSYDVTAYASVSVNVPTPTLTLQEKTVTENGEVVPDSGYDGLSKVIVNVASSGPAEPDPSSLYQRVEYITSAVEGTYPYIITDFYANNEAGLEVIASFPILQDRIPMGSRANSDATRFYCVYPLSSSSVYYGFNTGSSISCSLTTNTKYRLQTNFLNSRQVAVFTESGTRKASTTLNATLTEHPVPVSIFGYNSGSTGQVTSKREYKFYGARCSRGHEIVREYIPCYRKSDGVVGVYETFTQTFLTSEIDATFIAGAEIDW